MNIENLRFVADALLALCENESAAPYYTDREMQQRQMRDRMIRSPVEPMMRGEASDMLLDHEWKDVLRLAKLTEKQNSVLHDRLRGMPFELIGRRQGHSKQAAQSIFLAALKKITRARDVYAYTGLSDVYRYESHRGLHLSPRRQALVQSTPERKRMNSVRSFASRWSPVSSAAP